VASLARPGGNVTGFTPMEGSMGGKWLELLKEIAPRVNRVAFMFNPATAPYAEYFLNPFKAAAASFAVEAITAPVRDTSGLESVIVAQTQREMETGVAPSAEVLDPLSSSRTTRACDAMGRSPPSSQPLDVTAKPPSNGCYCFWAPLRQGWGRQVVKAHIND